MPIPSLQLQKKAPVSCREAKRSVKQLWSDVQYSDCVEDLEYRRLIAHSVVTAVNQWTAVEIELLATVGWKWGCQPFSCPCSQKMTGCRKEICSTYLLKVSIADIPLRNAKHPLCSRSLRLLRAAVRSTSSALCLHFAFTMLAKDPGPLSKIPDLCFMQRSTGFGHRVVVSKICYNAVIVLSVVLWDCCRPMNTRRDWAFSNSGLEVGLPAFQLPMFTKRDRLPKGDLFDLLVEGLHRRHSFAKCHHQLSIMLAFCLQKIPSL